MADEMRNQSAPDTTELFSSSGSNRSGKYSRPESGKKRGIAIACVAAAVVLACAVGGGLFYADQSAKARAEQEMMEKAVDTDRFYSGVVVQGVDVGGMTMDQAKTAVREAEASARGAYQIDLTYGGKSWQITDEDLNFSYDTEKVLEEAYQYGRSGELKERYETVEALRETPKEFSLTADAQLGAVDERLDGIAKEIERAPKDATVKSFDPGTEAFTFEEGQNGLSVDQPALKSRVEQAIQTGGIGQVEIPVKEVPYTVGVSDLKGNLKKLGTYTTTSTNTANGNHNMQLAFSRVNGTVVPAGGTFSYLGVVGNSDRANGYRPAGAILNGKLIQEYGGGICQTSTTIYGAALRSGMEIVERYNHSIKSTYCPVGQDAAVSTGALDFKFKNTTPYPVYISAGMSGRVLTVTFYGWQSPDYDKIEITSQQTGTVPAITTPKYTVEKGVPKGYMRLDAQPRMGYKAAAQRIYYKDGKVVKTENLPGSYYRPAPAFYSIGPDTDPKEAKLIGRDGKVSEAPVSSAVSSAPPAPAPSAPASSAPAPESSSTPSDSSVPESISPSSEPVSSGAVTETPAEDVMAETSSNPVNGGDPTSGIPIPE